MSRSSEKHDYVVAWKIVLTSLLGWNEEAVENWAHRWKAELDTDEGWFYHELPGYYITDLLLEKYCKDIPGKISYQRKFNKVADFIDFVNHKYMWDYSDIEISVVANFLKQLG